MFTPSQSELERFQKSPDLAAGNWEVASPATSYPSPSEWTNTNYSSPTNQGYASGYANNGYYNNYNQGSPSSVPANTASTGNLNSPTTQTWAYPESPTQMTTHSGRRKTSEKEAIDIQREKAASYKAQKLLEKSFGDMGFSAQNVALARKATSNRIPKAPAPAPSSPEMQHQPMESRASPPQQNPSSYQASSGNRQAAPSLPANLGTKTDLDIRREKAAASKAQKLLQASIDPFAGRQQMRNTGVPASYGQQQPSSSAYQHRRIPGQSVPSANQPREAFTYNNIPQEYLRNEPPKPSVRKSSIDVRRELVANSQAQVLLQQAVTEPHMKTGSKSANAKAIRDAAIQRHKMKKRMMKNAQYNRMMNKMVEPTHQAHLPPVPVQAAPAPPAPVVPQSVLDW